MNFSEFGLAVAKQFHDMTTKGKLYRTDVDNDSLWTTYLTSFPAGSDPIFRVRSHHDCNCCKQFIRKVGNVVAFIDGKIVTIWDVLLSDPNYQVVADDMSALVKSKKVKSPFLHYEPHAGTKHNFEINATGSTSKKWEHFYVNIPKQYVVKKADLATLLGEKVALFDVLTRSLSASNNDGISDDSIDTVLELIAQNSLYRGEEHKENVTAFKKIKSAYTKATNKDAFVWDAITETSIGVIKIRNTVIGTLLTDLSAGVTIDNAVGAFEAKVAPTNYKRPTAVVTKSMIDAAKKKVEELGLVSALDRRYATLDDVAVTDVIFVDRTMQNKMANDDVFGSMTASIADKKTAKPIEMSIDAFLSDVVPLAKSLELFVESQHVPNFVTLTAPSDPTANNMFMWENQFGWSYNGDVTDSIKQKVKLAGGNVTGDLCCRLAWNNYDDLDLHLVEPGGYEIHFGNRGRRSPCGGNLDVDMNAGRGTSRTPVENIFFENRKSMKEGIYRLFVHVYNKRETIDSGFDVEVDFMGDTMVFHRDNSLSTGAVHRVLSFRYSRTAGIEVIESMAYSGSKKEVWGLQQSKFVPVKLLMNSPNHWGNNKIGNKHYFFMLNGCINDGTARGFYNEFLKAGLTPHRKVLEIVGSKMRTEKSEEQLSGLGFSTTNRNSILCRVSGSFSRIIKILF